MGQAIDASDFRGHNRGYEKSLEDIVRNIFKGGKVTLELWEVKMYFTNGYQE